MWPKRFGVGPCPVGIHTFVVHQFMLLLSVGYLPVRADKLPSQGGRSGATATCSTVDPMSGQSQSCLHFECILWFWEFG